MPALQPAGVGIQFVKACTSHFLGSMTRANSRIAPVKHLSGVVKADHRLISQPKICCGTQKNHLGWFFCVPTAFVW